MMTMTDATSGPDPRTAPDDDEDATNHGVSSPEPAEGANDAPAGDADSPAP